MVWTPVAISRCFVAFQISHREDNMRLPTLKVVPMIRSRSPSIAGEWYTILRDCDAPNSARPVTAKLSRAMGIVEQLFISNAEQPPCSAPAGLTMSSSTVISKTVRPSSFSDSSAIFSNDISFHTILEAISDSKPLAPLGLASCS